MLKTETYQVVVKKFLDCGIKKIKFEGTKEACYLWLNQHRWGYYELLGPDGRVRSYVLGVL